jgi:prophage regulatory protein
LDEIEGNGMTEKADVTSSLAADQRFIREKEVRNMTGLSHANLWRLVRLGQFPQRFKLSEFSVAWRRSEVRAWMESRLAGRE